MFRMVLVLLVLFPAPAMAVEYQHSVKAGDMTLQWTLGEQTLDIKLTAKTSGWVGIGFNPTRAMKDAAFFIGAVADGMPKVTQHYGDSAYNHSKAMSASEFTNVTGREENGLTEITFSLPAVFKDSKFKPIQTNSETLVLLAYATDDSFSAKHRFRAEKIVNLATGAVK